MRVLVAETHVRLAAEHVRRGAPLPRLALPAADGSVLGVARAALAAVQEHPDHSAHWSAALETLALAELLTLQAGAEGAEGSEGAEGPANAPPAPTRATAVHHAAGAVHLAPWRTTARRVLAAASD